MLWFDTSNVKISEVRCRCVQNQQCLFSAILSATAHFRPDRYVQKAKREDNGRSKKFPATVAAIFTTTTAATTKHRSLNRRELFLTFGRRCVFSTILIFISDNRFFLRRCDCVSIHHGDRFHKCFTDDIPAPKKSQELKLEYCQWCFVSATLWILLECLPSTGIHCGLVVVVVFAVAFCCWF